MVPLLFGRHSLSADGKLEYLKSQGKMMRKTIVVGFVLFVLFGIEAIAFGASGTQGRRLSIPIESGWQFRQRVEGTSLIPAEWRPATVPGVVHTDLLNAKLIPDPFYRDNEAKLQWTQDADWEYRTTFTASPEVMARQHVDLVFEGLDTLAEVYVNGALVLKADNMFREWRADVKSHLKTGPNEVLVFFPSVIKEAPKIAARDPWRAKTAPLPPEKTYVRKAAYEYGWDWGPTFVTCGIWRPVRLEGWDSARISNVYVRQKDISKAAARISVEVEVLSAGDAKADISVEASLKGKARELTQSAQLHAGVNSIVMPMEIANPELWYPNGYGAHPVYTFHASVKISGLQQDVRDAKTGLRSIVLRRDVDQWGRSFEFIINGIPVFGKGADVIPFDSFPSRVTEKDYRKVLQSAVDANMNMVRHWGGGYYETDMFYDICDELGIMVWQDFMFGNEWQPGDYTFKLNVQKEVEYQVKRLRNHPSIIIWCGNNETEGSWEWHGDVTSKLSADVQRHMWQDYLTLFSSVIAQEVQRLDPEVPYWPSSPSADYEEVSDSYQSGDVHNWQVWHGMAPFTDYEKSFPRFMTEFGFQSFPEMRTIESFTLPEDRTGITTPVMLVHQKNKAGNQKIHEYLLRDYPEPKDFPSFLYVSQVLQAEAIKTGAEHLRRIRPRSMGSIYWQLNDCWPVASWASLDYYGRWKALHYYARRFYNDVLVLPREENGAIAVYIVSDRTAATKAELKLRLMTMDGKIIKESSSTVDVEPLGSKVYLQMPRTELLNANGADPTKVFAVAELTSGGKTLSNNLLFFVPTKSVDLLKAKVATELRKVGGGYLLKLSSDVLARHVYIQTGSVDATLSDNYFDLLPGTAVEVKIASNASEKELGDAVKVMSLTDAF